MATEHAEEAAVLVFLQGSQIGCQGLVLATREAQLSAHLLVGTYVEFGEVDVLNQFGILRDGSIDILFRRSVDVVMALHTDAVDRHSLLLHLLYHIINTVALAGVGGIVVVVEQQGIGISFVSKLESLGDELVTAELPMAALTVGIAFVAWP